MTLAGAPLTTLAGAPLTTLSAMSNGGIHFSGKDFFEIINKKNINI